MTVYPAYLSPELTIIHGISTYDIELFRRKHTGFSTKIVEQVQKKLACQVIKAGSIIFNCYSQSPWGTDGTMPSHELLLTSHYWSYVALAWRVILHRLPPVHYGMIRLKFIYSNLLLYSYNGPLFNHTGATKMCHTMTSVIQAYFYIFHTLISTVSKRYFTRILVRQTSNKILTNFWKTLLKYRRSYLSQTSNYVGTSQR